MAKKVEVTSEEFMRLDSELRELGFQRKFKKDMKNNFERLGLELTRHQRKAKGEVGYEFTKNGLTVHVWSSWVEEDGKANKNDYGWILISNGDPAKYFAKPFRRTEGFVTKLLSYAWISQWKVIHRPLCSECKRFMDITSPNLKGRPLEEFLTRLRQRFWVCNNPEAHEKPVYLNWDAGLGPKAKAFLAQRRKETAAYNKKRKLEGKNPSGTAILKRAGTWEVRKPENMITQNLVTK